jgi:hypothetical protein
MTDHSLEIDRWQAAFDKQFTQRGEPVPSKDEWVTLYSADLSAEEAAQQIRTRKMDNDHEHR